MKPILFVHIPKTGGTSINNVLIENYSWKIPQVRLKNHQPIFILEKYNNLSDYFVFTVARNPFKRAYSYYEHYQRVNQTSLSFKHFLLDVQSRNKSIDELKHLDVIPTDSRTPFTPFTQSFYIFDSNGNIRIDKIYKNENMEELENDFGIKLPKLNVGNYDDSMYRQAYTQEMIDLVKQIYAEDFTNFNYSTNFT